MVTRWLQAERRTGSVRRPKTGVLPTVLKRTGLSSNHSLHFYTRIIRPVLECCAPVWHYVLTKAQTESLEAVQKCAIHTVHKITRGMPYLSMLFYSNLNSLDSRREDLSLSLFFEKF